MTVTDEKMSLAKSPFINKSTTITTERKYTVSYDHQAKRYAGTLSITTTSEETDTRGRVTTTSTSTQLDRVDPSSDYAETIPDFIMPPFLPSLEHSFEELAYSDYKNSNNGSISIESISGAPYSLIMLNEKHELSTQTEPDGNGGEYSHSTTGPGDPLEYTVKSMQWDGMTFVVDGAVNEQWPCEIVPYNQEQYGEYALLKVDLAVDNDRDGEIKFDGSDRTTEDTPYYFWLNNDKDDGNDDEAEDKEPITADSADFVISNKRDLEDFSRIHLEVNAIEDALVAGDLQFGLKWEDTVGDPEIKLYLHHDILGGTDYLTDDIASGMQINVSNYSNTLRDESDARSLPKGNTFIFKRSFFAGLNSSAIKPLLFEATGAGSGQLVPVILKDGVEIGTGSGVWFDLKDIKKMYQHFTVGTRDNTFMGKEEMNPAIIASEINEVWESHLDEMNLDDDYILFVHGWRMKAWERRYFAETAFKRLFWQGYKGRFGFFSWPTEWTSKPVGTAITDSENYMRSDEKAMRSGQGLAVIMNYLMFRYNDGLKIFAHSMGNVVVSEALLQGGEADTYIACQAATVARAYDANGPERLTSTRINDALSGKVGFVADFLDSVDDHPDVFANYPPTSKVYYDGISANTFSGIINHHNRQDDALAWWLAGQAKKPNGDYYYDSDEDRWYLDDAIRPVPDTALFFPANTYEILARAAEPDSVPLGASVTTGHTTAGEISGNANLNALYDFQDGDEDHSAQFRSTVQRRWNYWEGLLNDFYPAP